MRVGAITTLAALGLAGVLFAPMTANAAPGEPPMAVQAAAAQAAANAVAKDGGHHGGDEFELIGFFDFLHECVRSADFIEDRFDADTVCVPARGGEFHGEHHGHDGGHGGEDKDWLLFAAFPSWVHHHHH